MKETTAKTSTLMYQTKPNWGPFEHMGWGLLGACCVEPTLPKVKNLLQNVGWKHTIWGQNQLI